MASARVSALRILARQRLTESALWRRLDRKGFPDDEIRATVERCRTDGLLDDRLFAQLYVAGTRKELGDARLVAELVHKGVAPDIARTAVLGDERGEGARCEGALAKLLRTKPNTEYASVARALERLGFPAAMVYRMLRDHAVHFGPLADLEMTEVS